MTRNATSGPKATQAPPAPKAGPGKRTFKAIITDYWSKEQRGSALAYLKSLPREELRSVAREHGSGGPLPSIYGLESALGFHVGEN